MRKSLFKNCLVALLAMIGVSAWAADPDFENDYTLVKSITFGDGADFAGTTACAYTAYDTGNKKQQSLTILTAPADAAGWIALQAWANGGSGKGWWNRQDKGLYCINAGRSACVFGDDLTTGWLVVFECTQTASNVITLNNGAGEPDGTFSYVASEDGKSYFCTITAAENAYVGFCGNKNAMAINKISVYKPNKAVVATTYTVNYVDMDGNTLKESVTYDAIGGASISLSDADKANILVGEDTYVYDSDDTEGMTVAEDGSTVVTVKFHKAQNFNYVVNEVANGSIVRSTTNFSYETAKVTVPYRKYNALDGKLYTKGATNKEYNYSFTLTSEGQTENIDYAIVEGVENVVFLSEGEDIDGLTSCNSVNTSIRSSNSASAFAPADTKITTLPAGKYKMHAVIYDASKEPNSNWTFMAGAIKAATFNCTTVNIQEFDSEEFAIGKETDIIFAKAGNNNMGLDMIYIVKTSDVTEEEAAELNAAAEAAEALVNAKADLQKSIEEAKAIDTTGKEGIEELNAAIAAAEAALAAEDATVESLNAAKNALIDAVEAFAFANKVDYGEIWSGQEVCADLLDYGFISLDNKYFKELAKVGDIIRVTVTDAGEDAQEARSAAPMREMRKNAGLRLMDSQSHVLFEKSDIQGDNQVIDIVIEETVKVGDADENMLEALAEGDNFYICGRNLTITKVELIEKAEGPASELTNADFSESTPLDNHICGYGKDMANNGTTYYGLQNVEGWKYEILNGDDSNADFPNSGMGGGVFAYGSEWQLKGNSKPAPAAGPDGGEGNCLGFFAVWGCGGYYYQDIKLAAGTYTLIVPMYNQSGTQANESYTGFFVNNSDVKYTVSVNPTVGTWSNQSVTFTLEEDTEGQIRVGYKSTGSGSGANPMLFIDCVKVQSELEGAQALYYAALEAANAATDEIVTGEENQALADAIAANSNIDITSVEALKAATEALNAAVATYNAAKAAYQALAKAKADVAALNFPYATDEKKAEAQAASEAVATSADDAVAKKTALLKAYRVAVESSGKLESVATAVDMTELIVNPLAEEAIAEPWVVTLGEGSGGSLDVKSNEPFTDAEDNSAYNYFDGGNWGANAWDVSMTQPIELPKGKYQLTVTSRASNEMQSFALIAGEEKVEMQHIGASIGTGLFDRGWNDASVEFELNSNSTVTIGVQGVASSIHQWMSFSRFRLFAFDDTVTGINEVSAQKNNEGTIFNLQGQQVKNAQKGLFIINGKKMILK